MAKEASSLARRGLRVMGSIRPHTTTVPPCGSGVGVVVGKTVSGLLLSVVGSGVDVG